MKRTINTTIRTIATIGFIMICVFLFGNMQVSAAEPTLKLESIIDMAQVIDFVANNDSLQLYFNDGTGYYWEKEIDSVSEIIENKCIQYECIQYYDNYIDMNTVISFDTTEYGLQLYLNNGNGYYWEW